MESPTALEAPWCVCVRVHVWCAHVLHRLFWVGGWIIAVGQSRRDCQRHTLLLVCARALGSAATDSEQQLRFAGRPIILTCAMFRRWGLAKACSQAYHITARLPHR